MSVIISKNNNSPSIFLVNSFDKETPSKINPKYNEDRIKCDACIVTFSNIIEEYVLKKYNPVVIGKLYLGAAEEAKYNRGAIRCDSLNIKSYLLLFFYFLNFINF